MNNKFTGGYALRAKWHESSFVAEKTCDEEENHGFFLLVHSMYILQLCSRHFEIIVCAGFDC